MVLASAFGLVLLILVISVRRKYTLSLRQRALLFYVFGVLWLSGGMTILMGPESLWHTLPTMMLWIAIGCAYVAGGAWLSERRAVRSIRELYQRSKLALEDGQTDEAELLLKKASRKMRRRFRSGNVRELEDIAADLRKKA
jgi:hypothetical protein